MTLHKDIDLWAREKNISKEDADRQHKTANRILQLLEHQPGVMLADEVGMGKTFVAIATALSYVSQLDSKKRVLILTPSKELKDKWDKDIDTFRDYCIIKGSPLKELARDKGIDNIKELFYEQDMPIITMPLSRLVYAPKEEEMRCYLGAYFRKRGFSANKRREILKRVLNYDLREYNDAKVMSQTTWFRGDFLEYERVKEADFRAFDELIRDSGTQSEFKLACLRVRNSLIPEFPFCIVDEAHNYKNPWVKGNRLFNSKEDVDTLKGKFHKLLFLTATPFQLGYEELLNIFRMFKTAKTCPSDYDERLKVLETHLSNYYKKVEGFERKWHRFSKNQLPTYQGIKDIYTCGDKEIVSAFEDVKVEKEALQVLLRNYIVRNTKDKGYRRVIVGSCAGDCSSGIDIPNRDKPLFYTLLRLQEEIENDVDLDTKTTWLTQSSLTSTYSTLKGSKILNEPANNRIITNYQQIVKHLIENDNSKHPKVRDVVSKIVERYFLGEKSLVFTFYRETASALADEVKKAIETRNDKILKKMGNKRPLAFRDYIAKNISKPDDQKYLAVHENLALTYNIKGEIDFKELALILGKNGFRFALGKPNYKLLLRAYEHHIISKAKDTVPRCIAERVCQEDYVQIGLRTGDENSGQCSFLPYDVRQEDVDWLSRQTKIIQYLIRGPNIWQYHAETLKVIDDIELRRVLQGIVIRELLKSDFIIFELAKARLSDKSSDDTWIKIICETYNKKAIFNQSYCPETIKERVQRWLNRIIDEFNTVCDDKYSRERFLGRLKTLYAHINPADVASIDGSSNNRTAYFDAFNSPFKPNVLICTSIGSEGIDLQHECSAVFLYDLGWNPSAIEQKIGRIDRIGSKVRREIEIYQMKKHAKAPPVLEIYRPFIKGTCDEQMHRVLQHREKWFNFILGSGQRLSEDEDGDVAKDLRQILDEEEMLPLPDTNAKDLYLNLGVEDGHITYRQEMK